MLVQDGVVPGLKHHSRSLFADPAEAGHVYRQHEDGRDDDLVGRDGHDVGHHDDSGQPEHPAHRVEVGDHPPGDAVVGDGDVGDEPDDGPGRDGKDDGPPQHEQSPVDEGGVKGAQDPGRPIGRQLQAEGGDLPAQKTSAQHP